MISGVNQNPNYELWKPNNFVGAFSVWVVEQHHGGWDQGWNQGGWDEGWW